MENGIGEHCEPIQVEGPQYKFDKVKGKKWDTSILVSISSSILWSLWSTSFYQNTKLKTLLEGISDLHLFCPSQEGYLIPGILAILWICDLKYNYVYILNENYHAVDNIY